MPCTDSSRKCDAAARSTWRLRREAGASARSRGGERWAIHVAATNTSGTSIATATGGNQERANSATSRDAAAHTAPTPSATSRYGPDRAAITTISSAEVPPSARRTARSTDSENVRSIWIMDG